MTKIKWIIMILAAALIGNVGRSIMFSFDKKTWFWEPLYVDEPQMALFACLFVATIALIAWRVVVIKIRGFEFLGAWAVGWLVMWVAFMLHYGLAFGTTHNALAYATIPFVGSVAIGPPWFYQQPMHVMCGFVSLMAVLLGMALTSTPRPASSEPVQRAKVELKLVREGAPATNADATTATATDGQAKGATA